MEGQPIKRSPLIFVVDDEVAVGEFEQAVLMDMGCDVRVFVDPETALKAFDTLRPEIVLTDYWMPRMSGMDLIRECRRINPAQKTVLISGTVDGGVFAHAAIKPDRFLAKPFAVQAFKDLVTGLLTDAGEAGQSMTGEKPS